MKVEFAFASGKCVVIDTYCESIVEFFEKYGPGGELASWLVFADGHAVRTENVDWIRLWSDHE